MQVLSSYAENHTCQDVLQRAKFLVHRKAARQDDPEGSLVLKADWSFCFHKMYTAIQQKHLLGAQQTSVVRLYVPF